MPDPAARSPSDASDASDGPRWLTAQERAAWLSLVGVMVKLPAALDAQLQRDADLSYIEYMVLAMLSEQPNGQLRMSELAAFINSSLSRLSHVAKRLERQGFLRREPDTTDGRYTNAVLTKEGLIKVVDTAPGHVAAVRSLVFDALTPGQIMGLQEAGDRIIDKVEPGAARSLRSVRSRPAATGGTARSRVAGSPAGQE